ncbi:MAG: serine/threonine protein kinase, partial [Candidatus Obscuribacterales bacterium]|nr:serine/threonine protein kinase [Candidatus Obscuribacterales bacterium]
EFALEELLGEGAHGVVFKAMHKRLASHVAIKFIKFEATESQRMSLASLKRELKACSKLDHPSIVKLLQLGVGTDSTPFLVYEYLQGQTLQSYLDTNAVIPKHVLSCVFEQVCDALSYAHSQGVVHRDIKPSNIMILTKSASSMMQVKILDFGLAQIIDNEKAREDKNPIANQAHPEAQTSTKMMTGSPLYMSPEQCTGGLIDARTDIYSFASVVYQCLLGETVFAGETPLHTLYMKMNQNPPLPNSRLSHKLNQLLMKALSKEPENRPEDINVFGKNLQEALKNWNIAVPKNSQKRNVICVAALLITILGAAFALPHFSMPKRQNNVLPSEQSKHPIKGIYAGKSFLSLSSEIDQTIAEYESHRILNQPKYAEICIKKLNSIMPSVRQFKNLHFIALDQRGDCEYSCGKLENAWNSFSECLKVAELKNGEMPWEAGKSYALLSLISYEKGKLKDAEKYANDSINLLLKLERAEEAPPSLKIPTFYRCMNRESVKSGMYHILAEVAMSRKEAAKALKFANNSVDSMECPWRDTILRRPFISKANLLLKTGNRHDAVETIETCLDEIQNKLDRERLSGQTPTEIKAVRGVDCRDDIEGYYAGIAWLAANSDKKELIARCNNLLKLAELEHVEQNNWFKELEQHIQEIIASCNDTK